MRCVPPPDPERNGREEARPAAQSPSGTPFYHGRCRLPGSRHQQGDSTMTEAITLATTETIPLQAAEARVEHDLLGDTEVPSTAYWGVHTKRAVENFPIPGVPVRHFPDLVRALAMVKQAAARANRKRGHLPQDKALAIEQTCDAIIGGRFAEQFVVDAIQGGAGTSTNMNANEVIANLALKLIGRAKGDYAAIHPNNDVNMAQSTNDAYPTALRLAIVLASAPLFRALEDLAYALKGKAVEFDHVLKMGRTQLQDAVPMTLGQEFDAFHVTIKEDIARVREIVGPFREVNLGRHRDRHRHQHRSALCGARGRGAGAGLGSARGSRHQPGRGDLGYGRLRPVLGPLGANRGQAFQDLQRPASALERAAHGLGRDPPVVQAGSSIMPGKVNPVIPEVVNQVAYLVIGHDLTVTLCAEGGQLQLNAFEPTIGYCILQSMRMLIAAFDTLTKRCVVGIEADQERCRRLAVESIGIVTALNPVLGYDACSRVAKRTLQENRAVTEIVVEEGLLTAEQVEKKLLTPEAMTQPSGAAFTG
jgi:aspartate ammonia-lyase